MELFFTMSAMPEAETRELARGLRARDPALLGRLVEQYQYRLLRYLLALTRDRSLAEDLFQETWLRVLERGGQYNPRFRFEPWLFSIARHLFLDRVRRRPELTLGGLEDGEGAAFDLPDDRSPSAYELYRRAERKDEIDQALHHVASLFREVLVLRFQEELTMEEIATVTGALLPTVKSRLYRGLSQLRAALPPGVDV
jgi:RNA polymerase sigma-70 factor, ECF subfamily